jgi:hypothetical protein
MTISTTTTPPSAAYALRRMSSTEQQLVAARPLAQSETVLCEKPVVHVDVGHYRLSTYVWDMVDLLLADKVLLLQFTRCHLFAPPAKLDAEDEMIEAHLVKKYRKSRQFIRNLFFGVATNNVGIIDEDRFVRGHGVYPWLSRTNHSCEPNTALAPANWRAAEASLVAKRDIRVGEPLTWCYFREEEFLPQDWLTRNYNLVNLYRFTCRCPRCQTERPADVPASPAGQVAYIDKLIVKAAREIAHSPKALEQLRAESPVNVHRERLLASRNR